MKRSFFLLLLSTIGLVASAQDLIVLKDATEILAKSVFVTQKTILYSDNNDPSASQHKIDRNEVLLIKFESGRVKLLPRAMAQARITGALKNRPDSFEEIPDVYVPVDETRRTGVSFQGYLWGALGTNSKQSLIDFGCSAGARFADYFFIGPEIGFGEYKDKKADKSSFLFYFTYGFNLRGYYPAGNNLYPFISLSLGGLASESKDVNSKAFARISAGIDKDALSVGAGWAKICDKNYFHITVAWRFGK